MNETDLGQVAYAAYCVASDGKSLATWELLSPEIRAAWRATADGVRMYLDLHGPVTLDLAARYVMRLQGDARWERVSSAIKDQYRDQVKEILELCGIPTTVA